MTTRDAIQILMLSPFYFKLSPSRRKKLIDEYCQLYEVVTQEIQK